MWSLKSKCSSIKTPRYLVQVFCLIFWPLKQKLIYLVICFLGDQKIRISVLLTFKAILFAWSHWTRFDRSKVIFLLMSLRELLAYNRFVSSARWCIFKFFIDQLKLFMYMRNNKAPKMEPCGTPYLMVWVSDLSLLMFACWVLSLR